MLSQVVGVRIVLNCRTSIWCHRTAWCGHTHLRGIRGRTLTYPFPSLSLLSLSPLISWLFREYLSNPVAGLFHQLLLLSRELFLGILMAHSLTLSRCHLGCHLIRNFPDDPYLLLIILCLLTLNIFVCVIHNSCSLLAVLLPNLHQMGAPKEQGSNLVCAAVFPGINTVSGSVL